MSATNASPEPREVAGDLIGRLILAFGEMELHVSLSLGHMAATPEFALFTPIADSLVLKQKLDILNEMVATRSTRAPACWDEFIRWYRPLRRLRHRRDSIIHGYWDNELGVLRPVKFKKYPTMTRTLAELREECRRAEALRESFRAWRERWLA